MWSEPFFAPGPINSGRRCARAVPATVIDIFAATVSRPAPAASAPQRGLFRGRGRGPAPDFKLTMRPRTHEVGAQRRLLRSYGLGVRLPRWSVVTDDIALGSGG